jgi:hypothetical protein
VTGPWAVRWGNRNWIAVGAGNFSLRLRVVTGPGDGPVSCPVGTVVLFPGLPRQEHDANRRVPSSGI